MTIPFSFSDMCKTLGHPIPTPLSGDGPPDRELMLLMALWDVSRDVRVTVIFPDEPSARAANLTIQRWFDALKSGGDGSPKFGGMGIKYVAGMTLPSESGSVSFPGLSMWTARQGVGGIMYVSPDVPGFGGGLPGPYRFAHRVVQAEGAMDVVEPDGTLLLRVDVGGVEDVFRNHFVRLLGE